jgi:hypothetical protein
MNIPIIKIEFESMRQSLRIAMTEQMVTMDSNIKEAIDKYCTVENLQYIINSEVMRSVNEAVKEEVQSLFKYSGAGRKAIREQIKKYADDVWVELDD